MENLLSCSLVDPWRNGDDMLLAAIGYLVAFASATKLVALAMFAWVLVTGAACRPALRRAD